jgi:hypothetical protein
MADDSIFKRIADRLLELKETGFFKQLTDRILQDEEDLGPAAISFSGAVLGAVAIKVIVAALGVTLTAITGPIIILIGSVIAILVVGVRRKKRREQKEELIRQLRERNLTHEKLLDRSANLQELLSQWGLFEEFGERVRRLHQAWEMKQISSQRFSDEMDKIFEEALMQKVS